MKKKYLMTLLFLSLLLKPNFSLALEENNELGNNNQEIVSKEQEASKDNELNEQKEEKVEDEIIAPTSEEHTGNWVQENNETYYVLDGKKIQGFQKIGDKTYFFGIGSCRLLKGWQSLGAKQKFYLYEDGSVKQGWQHIGTEDYYVENNFMVEGFHTIGDKTYFFGNTSARLLHGWQSLGAKQKFYLYEDGSVKQGWQHIGVEDYYVENNFMVEGFHTVEDKTYFFGNTSARLLHGWQSLGAKKKFYLYEDGSVKQGWQHIGAEDYYAENNFMVEGFHTIENKTYFFGNTSARLLHGWQSLGAKQKFYLHEDGSILPGINVIDGKTYYVKDNFVVTGLQTIDGILYYFDNNGVRKGGQVKVDNTDNFYIFDEVTNEFKMIQYIPHYYMQKDERWKNVMFLKGTMGGSGCTPTSLAMAFQSLLGKTILPIDVANWLYYNTDTFNKKSNGANGMAIIEAGKHWNIEITPINDIDTLNSELQKGKMVYAAMTNGKFATLLWNHAIIISQYSQGKTYAHDPLNINNNGWISTTQIWNEQSKDPDDLLGGAALYSLEKK